jgi:hypothetical protein
MDRNFRLSLTGLYWSTELLMTLANCNEAKAIDIHLNSDTAT